MTLNLEEAAHIAKVRYEDTFAPKTERLYRRAWNRLQKANMTPQEFAIASAEAGDPLKKEQYYQLKGAYQLFLARDFVEAEKGGDGEVATRSLRLFALQKPDYKATRYKKNQARAHDVPLAQDDRFINPSKQLLEKLTNAGFKEFGGQFYGPPPCTEAERESRKLLLGEAKEMGEKVFRYRKKGRRKNIKQIEKRHPNWQEDIFDALPEQWRMAMAVLVATGCRPAELSKGIDLEVHDGKLTIKIRGAKTGHGYGQEIRTLIFEPKSYLEKELARVIEEVGGEGSWIMEKTYKGLYKAHALAAEAALGKDGKRIGLYSHRHKMSADLKASGIGVESVALALGHSSAKTQSWYGLGKQGDGKSRGLESVIGTQDVRHLDHNAQLSQAFGDDRGHGPSM